jgi:acyl-CoA synthetase (AMP-forming)/AMP-acid ligase II
VPGDHATVDADGTITVLGRGSVSINSGGEKIYPEEVEKALKHHPSVYDAVVVGTPNARFGQQVTAVVQTRAGETPTEDELGEFARATSPATSSARDPLRRRDGAQPVRQG